MTDRPTSGSATDVSRLEHENLCGQVDETLRRISRLELEIHQQSARIEGLEKVSRGVSRQQKR